MRKDVFKQNLERAMAFARGQTRQYCLNEIPDEARYLIILNASYDRNPLHADEKVFPDHDAPQVNKEILHTSDQVVDRLWRDGFVPEWIDITSFEVLAEVCSYELRCCGRFTANDELLYHRERGCPPFHPLGPVLPCYDYKLERDGKFDLHHYRNKKGSKKEV